MSTLDRIQRTAAVCGGDARVVNHRITVWHMVLSKKMGLTDAELLAAYPQLTADDLAACWEYYQREPVEIERQIWLNDTAGNIPTGSPVPAGVIIAGKLLGLSDQEVAEAFDEPLAPDAVRAMSAAPVSCAAGR